MKKQKDLIPKISAHVQFETVSPATKLLEKRRKMYQVHQAFEVQKEEYKKQEESFKGIEEDIRKRDLEIQIHLINFCQFLQENDSKRKKAIERYNQEKQVYQKKCEQIQKLQEQISSAYGKQQKFDKKVSSLRKYEQFLEKVRSTFSDQYPQMSDILSRYQTLKKSNKKLITEKTEMQETKQRIKKDSSLFEREMSQTILTLGNDNKDLSKRLEEKLNQKQNLQSQLERSRDQYARKNLDLAKILMALDNLYFKCQESTIRVKHDLEEFKGEKEAKKTKKKIEKKNEEKKVKDEAKEKQEQENNLELKCEIALQKLKSIFAYTKDYKLIIDLYKKGLQQKQ